MSETELDVLMFLALHIYSAAEKPKRMYTHLKLIVTIKTLKKNVCSFIKID